MTLFVVRVSIGERLMALGVESKYILCDYLIRGIFPFLATYWGLRVKLINL